MKKSWFYDLGGFDPGMKLWGSEQFEMSVKARYYHLINNFKSKKKKQRSGIDTTMHHALPQVQIQKGGGGWGSGPPSWKITSYMGFYRV